MGIPASTYLLGVQPGSTNREDLTDMICNIDAWETPLFVACPKVQISSTYHEWQTDTLAATSTIGAKEGADFAEADSTAPTRLGNRTMILRKDFKVTQTQRAMNPAGANDWYQYEVQKGLKELARNTEACFLAASGASLSGATGVSSAMKSVAAFLSTNVEAAGSTLWGLDAAGGAGPASATLMTEDRFNVMLEHIFNSGGNPDSAYVNAATKRHISAFSGQGASRRNIAMAEKKLIASVDMYDSDMGLIQIVLDRWVRQITVDPSSTSDLTAITGEAFFIETPMVQAGILRPFRHVPLAPIGDAARGMILGEFTAIVLNEKSCGKFWGCSNIDYPAAT